MAALRQPDGNPTCGDVWEFNGLLDSHARNVLHTTAKPLGKQGMNTCRAGEKVRHFPGRRAAFLVGLCTLCLAQQAWAARASGGLPAADTTIIHLRVGTYPTYTRVVLDTASPLEWSIQEEGKQALRVVVPGGVLAPDIRRLELRKGIVRAVEPIQRSGGVEVTLLSPHPHGKVRAFSLRDPDRIVIDVLIAGPGEAGEPPVQPQPIAPSPAITASIPSPPLGQGDPTAEIRPSGRRAEVSAQATRTQDVHGSPPADSPRKDARPSLPMASRGPGAAGLTVVLDPGHGGHDTGAVGPTGLMEKDVVLDLAWRLRRFLQERLGVRVILTREEDVFVPLQERTAIANRAKADFFISLHVNGAVKRGAVGFETFYFTREPSDNDARASAQRENLVIETDGTRAKDQESLLRITLADMAVTRDMRESSELAELVLGSLDKLLKVENRGVKSGPFYVLATAAMPAILVEGAFITNPKEERKLQREVYRQRVAEALYGGIAKYKARYERRVGTGSGGPAAADS